MRNRKGANAAGGSRGGGGGHHRAAPPPPPSTAGWTDSSSAAAGGGGGGAAAVANGVVRAEDEPEDATCPLCIEPLDETEARFRPCPCGYQVCLFCYKRIKLELNGLCPSCRTPYGEPQQSSPAAPPTTAKSRSVSPKERRGLPPAHTARNLFPAPHPAQPPQVPGGASHSASPSGVSVPHLGKGSGAPLPSAPRQPAWGPKASSHLPPTSQAPAPQSSTTPLLAVPPRVPGPQVPSHGSTPRAPWASQHSQGMASHSAPPGMKPMPPPSEARGKGPLLPSALQATPVPGSGSAGARSTPGGSGLADIGIVAPSRPAWGGMGLLSHSLASATGPSIAAPPKPNGGLGQQHAPPLLPKHAQAGPAANLGAEARPLSSLSLEPWARGSEAAGAKAPPAGGNDDEQTASGGSSLGAASVSFGDRPASGGGDSGQEGLDSGAASPVERPGSGDGSYRSGGVVGGNFSTPGLATRGDDVHSLGWNWHSPWGQGLVGTPPQSSGTVPSALQSMVPSPAMGPWEVGNGTPHLGGSNPTRAMEGGTSVLPTPQLLEPLPPVSSTPSGSSVWGGAAWAGAGFQQDTSWGNGGVPGGDAAPRDLLEQVYRYLPIIQGWSAEEMAEAAKIVGAARAKKAAAAAAAFGGANERAGALLGGQAPGGAGPAAGPNGAPIAASPERHNSRLVPPPGFCNGVARDGEGTLLAEHAPAGGGPSVSESSWAQSASEASRHVAAASWGQNAAGVGGGQPALGAGRHAGVLRHDTASPAPPPDAPPQQPASPERLPATIPGWGMSPEEDGGAPASPWAERGLFSALSGRLEKSASLNLLPPSRGGGSSGGPSLASSPKNSRSFGRLGTSPGARSRALSASAGEFVPQAHVRRERNGAAVGATAVAAAGGPSQGPASALSALLPHPPGFGAVLRGAGPGAAGSVPLPAEGTATAGGAPPEQGGDYKALGGGRSTWGAAAQLRMEGHHSPLPALANLRRGQGFGEAEAAAASASSRGFGHLGSAPPGGNGGGGREEWRHLDVAGGASASAFGPSFDLMRQQAPSGLISPLDASALGIVLDLEEPLREERPEPLGGLLSRPEGFHPPSTDGYLSAAVGLSSFFQLLPPGSSLSSLGGRFRTQWSRDLFEGDAPGGQILDADSSASIAQSLPSRRIVCQVCGAFSTTSEAELADHMDLCLHAASILE